MWITEAGPKHHAAGVGIDNDARGVEDTAKLLALPQIGTRVKRFYYYSMYGAPYFDSGMVHYGREAARHPDEPDAALRPAYCLYAQKTRLDYPQDMPTMCQ